MIGDEDIHDIPPYPDDWDADQRVSAYWYALHHCGIPANTDSWHTVWNIAQREHNRRKAATR